MEDVPCNLSNPVTENNTRVVPKNGKLKKIESPRESGVAEHHFLMIEVDERSVFSGVKALEVSANFWQLLIIAKTAVCP